MATSGLLITGTPAGFTVKVSVADPVPLALIATIVTELEPVAVGVPEITPVLVFTDRPTGSPAALKLLGLLDAAI